jgi:hypothetical protein
MTDSKVSTTFE